MPKINMSFNLPEEREEYEMAYNGGSYHCAISDILQLMREKIKYEDMSVERLKTYEEIRELVWGVLRSRDMDGKF